jgi:hypothetical protein
MQFTICAVLAYPFAAEAQQEGKSYRIGYLGSGASGAKAGDPRCSGVRRGWGVIAYGASLSDLSLRAATYVDRILRGAKPSDLPVQQPTKVRISH